MTSAAFVRLCVVALMLFSSAHALSGQSPTRALPRCRYDISTPAGRVKHDELLRLAQAVTSVASRVLAESRSFETLASDARLPTAPSGVKIRILVDASGYILSVRDDSDPCAYTIFSDERGRYYEGNQIPLLAGR